MKRKTIKGLIIITTAVLIGYGSYKLYNYAIENAIKRIKTGVRQSIVNTINPLKWPSKIFGHKKKTNEEI